MSLLGGGPYGAVVEPQPIENQLLRSGLPFVPRIGERFGGHPSLELPELHVRYETAFESAVDVPLWLVMEPEALAGDWSVSFDGAAPFGAGDLVPLAGPVEGCVGFELVRGATDLAGGEGVRLHTLVVQVKTSAGNQGLRDSMYVAGDFGVWATAVDYSATAKEVPVLAKLGAPAEEVAFGDLKAAGLPYFAGVIEYERPFELPRAGPADPVLVDLEVPGGFEDALKIAFGEEGFHPVPWSPRRVLVPGREVSQPVSRVRIRQYTTLARAFEGRWFDPAVHAYRAVELAPSPHGQRA
jgi:hypothetical protein